MASPFRQRPPLFDRADQSGDAQQQVEQRHDDFHHPHRHLRVRQFLQIPELARVGVGEEAALVAAGQDNRANRWVIIDGLREAVEIADEGHVQKAERRV
jgi:hypothetical protein